MLPLCDPCILARCDEVLYAYIPEFLLVRSSSADRRPADPPASMLMLDTGLGGGSSLTSFFLYQDRPFPYKRIAKYSKGIATMTATTMTTMRVVLDVPPELSPAASLVNGTVGDGVGYVEGFIMEAEEELLEEDA